MLVSPQFLLKERERGMGYRKKYGHMKVQVLKKKERKKCGHMKAHEKKEKKKIAMLSKEFI